MQKSIDPPAPTGFTSGLRPFTSKTRPIVKSQLCWWGKVHRILGHM